MSLTNVSASLFHRRYPVDVGQDAQAKALRAARVGEAVDGERGLRGVEYFADATAELVV